MTKEEFGANLRRIRKSRRLSQSELGAIVGVHPSQVSRYETGQRGLPKRSQVIEFGQALKQPPSEISRSLLLPADYAPLEPTTVLPPVTPGTTLSMIFREIGEVFYDPDTTPAERKALLETIGAFPNLLRGVKEFLRS